MLRLPKNAEVARVDSELESLVGRLNAQADAAAQRLAGDIRTDYVRQHLTALHEQAINDIRVTRWLQRQLEKRKR